VYFRLLWADSSRNYLVAKRAKLGLSFQSNAQIAARYVGKTRVFWPHFFDFSA